MRYKTCVFLILALLSSSPVWAGGSQYPPVVSVSGADVSALLARQPLVLDVRVAGEERGADEKPWGLRCKACTTVRAPFDLDMGFFEDRHESALRRLRPGQTILVVCLAGVRAQKAAAELAEKGYRVQVLAGGLTALPSSLVYGARPPPRVAEK